MERVLQREVKGATPGVVAIRAKPPKEQQADKHLRKIRHHASKEEAIEASIKENEKFHLNVQWEKHINRSYINKLVQRKMEDAMQGFLLNTEERRNRLRELLEAEENQYLAEIEAKEITPEMRQEEMKETIRVIKEAREKERQDFVAKKRDQQFREQCEDLRIFLTQVHEQKVYEDRAAQMAFNEELRKQKMIEEKMYIDLWENDRLAKEKRAADEAYEKTKRDEQMLLCLKTQMAILNAQKEEARRLKKEEGLLMEKKVAQFKQDNEKQKLEKKRKMRQARDILQKALQDRNTYLAQERAEEVYLDKKLLEVEDDTELRQKKADTSKEQKLYQAYIKQCREAERLHEEETDRIIEAEAAKMRAKRDAQLMLARDARKQLKADVLATRRLQVIEKYRRTETNRFDTSCMTLNMFLSLFGLVSSLVQCSHWNRRNLSNHGKRSKRERS
ncbi:cilia- and flagella-associated protein 53 isoform X2 [Macrotis lagotis]|uniref:cilia- and flagella-associated protein 53 isoform X2 n=1 Tax=Macrotis lagotis TaxID=92651 RepID=UPI003D68F349